MSWSGGYVTQVDYVYGFYQDFSPAWLKTICRLQNVVVPEGPWTILELGCGQGYGLDLLAATNPADNFIGVDINPAHVVGGRHLAAAAELGNVTFLERSFEELAQHPELLPDCDVVALHGVYSWVGPAQREAIRSIIRQKLKSGGLVYISYNCMAGWGPKAAFQKIFRDMTLSSGAGPGETAPTIAKLQAYRAAGFVFFHDNKHISDLIDQISTKDLHYIAHEYMNEYWTPFYSHDIAKDMSDCKLTFVGSAQAAENVDFYAVPPQAMELVKSETDAALRESLRDLAIGRQFRRDIFIRGAIRQTQQNWVKSIGDIRLTSTKIRSEIEMKAILPRGILEMKRDSYREILDRMDIRPTSLAEAVGEVSSWHDIITVLLHSGWTHPLLDPVPDDAAAKRFNRVITASAETTARYGFLAVPMIGSGLPMQPRDRLAFSVAAQKPGIDVDELITACARLDGDPTYRSLLDLSPAAERASADPMATLGERLRLWRRLGMLD